VIERLDGMPTGVVGFRFAGEVSRHDYEDVLIPALQEAFESGEPLRCFCQVGPGFKGYEAGAMWEDLKTGAKYGIGHLSDWKRMALVTDVDWIRHLSALFGWMAPGELRLFELDEIEDAKSWVAG
jgi:hypothetical protein